MFLFNLYKNNIPCPSSKETFVLSLNFSDIKFSDKVTLIIGRKLSVLSIEISPSVVLISQDKTLKKMIIYVNFIIANFI